MKTLLQSLRLLFALSLLTGAVYPVVVTALTRAAFPHKTNGSLIRQGDRIVGSELLAQKFETARYFWSRPSAADYAAVPSGASNKGPTSADLQSAIAERRAKFGADAPGDMLTASGSGLDPHISLPAAEMQVDRVAQARNLGVDSIRNLIRVHTAGRAFGFLGEPGVNVLTLNLALDALD